VVKNNACQISSAPTNINLSTAAGTSTALTVEPAVTSTSVSTQQDDAITHPPFCSRILKHIPKGARPAVANLLTKLIVAVLQSPLSSSNWTKLLGFSAACPAKPNRGGKSRNLITQIVTQSRQYLFLVLFYAVCRRDSASVAHDWNTSPTSMFFDVLHCYYLYHDADSPIADHRRQRRISSRRLFVRRPVSRRDLLDGHRSTAWQCRACYSTASVSLRPAADAGHLGSVPPAGVT